MTLDKRVLLQFNDGAFADPFYAGQMSDGTLKIFAYLLLMEDPNRRRSSASRNRKMVCTIACWILWRANCVVMPPARRMHLRSL